MTKAGDFFRSGPEPSTAGTLLYVMFGLIVWAGQFTIVYAGHTLACALALAPPFVDILIIAVTLAALAAIATFLIWPRRMARLFRIRADALGQTGDAILHIARAIAILSAIAVTWSGGALAFVSVCALSR